MATTSRDIDMDLPEPLRSLKITSVRVMRVRMKLRSSFPSSTWTPRCFAACSTILSSSHRSKAGLDVTFIPTVIPVRMRIMKNARMRLFKVVSDPGSPIELSLWLLVSDPGQLLSCLDRGRSRSSITILISSQTSRLAWGFLRR